MSELGGQSVGTIITEQGLAPSLANAPLLQGKVVRLDGLRASLRTDGDRNVWKPVEELLNPLVVLEEAIATQALLRLNADEPNSHEKGLLTEQKPVDVAVRDTLRASSGFVSGQIRWLEAELLSPVEDKEPGEDVAAWVRSEMFPDAKQRRLVEPSRLLLRVASEVASGELAPVAGVMGFQVRLDTRSHKVFAERRAKPALYRIRPEETTNS